MPEAFKEKFNRDVIEDLAEHLQKQWPEFKRVDFITQAIYQLETLELKARSNQIKQALLDYMPSNFDHVASIIHASLAPASADENIQFETSPRGLAGWILMPLCDFITDMALIDKQYRYSTGLKLLHACTQRFTAEFSIRPFLRDHAEETLKVLETWAEDENVHVRRLVSEGSRPYLPWGIRLHAFVDKPHLILPLLDKLKNDESEYVRRSVANSLNDIAKVHPDLVAELVSNWWQPDNRQRTQLIKHACRTMLKNGHSSALSLFGFAPAHALEVSLSVSLPTVPIGNSQEMTLTIVNNANQAQKLLIDYAVYHQKANALLSPKIFKWSSTTLQANSSVSLRKRHSFKPVTTRKYYAGEHAIEIRINGQGLAKEVFQLAV